MDNYQYPYIELSNFNQLFKETKNPIIINDLPYTTKEEKQNFNKLIMTVYDTDIISSVPSCDCGDTKKGYKVGSICPNCKTRVIYNEDLSIEITTWLRVPDGIDGFIMPVIWQQLTNLLNSKGYNILEWIIDPKFDPKKSIFKPTKNTLQRIQYLESINWPRGLNNFIRYFDNFLDILYKFTKIKGTEYIDYLRTIPKDILFPQYLPMPTKAMLIIENTQLGSLAEIDKITGAIDACRTIADLSRIRHKPISHLQLESKVVTVINNLTGYYTLTIKNTFGPKKGWFRGLFRSKSHFCGRAVIISLNDVHHWQELHIPWAIGVELLRIHIESKLEKIGYSLLAANNLITNSINVYNSIIDKVIKELINETNELGIAVLLQRNPTLTRLSAQLFYISKVKTDLSDKTFSMSVLCLRGSNADFDGDELNLSLIMDNRFLEKAKLLSSHYGIFDFTYLGELSRVIDLPDVTTSTIANYVNYY